MAKFNISRLTKILGPGFVTGAADDDPSGVATYSIAGARYGYSMLWMSLFLIPGMVAIQEMCGRIGMVTGKGLAGVIKSYYSKKLLWFSILLLFVANVINIGADLGIIAASIEMLTGWSYWWWLFIASFLVIFLEVAVSYRKYASILRILSLTLLVYIVTAFITEQNWGQILPSFLIPTIEFNKGFMMTLVGFLGTTISPYLFFWQASEEVEEEIMENKISDFNQKPKVNKREIASMKRDTKVGMVFSNMITFFILLTTAGTLNRNGILVIDTPRMAAESLRPLAGDFAYLLFAVGIIGIGLQSIPVLAGSAAYAISEGLGIKEGLSKKFWEAKGFYFTIVLATVVGLLINLLKINTMQALYYAAIVNGVMAVPLIFLIIKIAGDKAIMGKNTTSKINNFIAWLIFIFMGAAVVSMVWGMFG